MTMLLLGYALGTGVSVGVFAFVFGRYKYRAAKEKYAYGRSEYAKGHRYGFEEAMLPATKIDGFGGV